MGDEEIVFIDANIFLEIILKDKMSEECKSFLLPILSGKKKAVTSDFIIYTCFIQIQYKLKSLKEMNNFLLFINECKSLKILRPSLQDMKNALLISGNYLLDFDDSLIVSCMMENNIKRLVTLDTDFRKMNNLIEAVLPF